MDGCVGAARGAPARAALGVGSVRIDAMRGESPRIYADQQAKYLARLDEIAREIGDEGVAYDVADQYFTLGMMVRQLVHTDEPRPRPGVLQRPQRRQLRLLR